MTNPHISIYNTNNVKILVVADIRGNLSYFNTLSKIHNPDFIIHTGNFGFIDNESISKIHESYLRHIVEFSPLLSKDLILKISQLSKVQGDSVHHLSNDNINLKSILLNSNQQISQLMDFINGDKNLNIPVYTIYGMCEDSNVINKFRNGTYKINNLHIIDDYNLHSIKFNNGSQSILLAGIGGSLSYHKLFHQGTSNNIIPLSSIIPISGDPGNIWITMLQLGKLFHSLLEYSENNPNEYNKSIKILVTHQSPTREPLLEHLSIFFKFDYTISNSLHFKYISSFNDLTINTSFETFKIKFSDSRLKLLKIWIKIQKKYEKLLSQFNNYQLASYIHLALSIYDKIPISKSSSSSSSSSTDNTDENISLSLSPSLINSIQSSNFNNLLNLLSKHELNQIIRHINDLYYVSFQNCWHYNICDVENGYLLLNYNLQNNKFSMNTYSEGFDFSYRFEAT